MIDDPSCNFVMRFTPAYVFLLWEREYKNIKQAPRIIFRDCFHHVSIVIPHFLSQCSIKSISGMLLFTIEK
jgi:hypothetical protein